VFCAFVRRRICACRRSRPRRSAASRPTCSGRGTTARRPSRRTLASRRRQNQFDVGRGSAGRRPGGDRERRFDRHPNSQLQLLLCAKGKPFVTASIKTFRTNRNFLCAWPFCRSSQITLILSLKSSLKRRRLFAPSSR
jgi:hypothetical protein